MENRNRPAVTPKDSSSLGGSPTCVLVAGWHTKVSGPPNDVAMCAIRSFDTKASQVAKSPSSSRANTVPPNRICRRASSCCACDSRNGCCTETIFAWLSRDRAMVRADVFWCCRRTPSVRNPRRAFSASCGDGDAPCMTEYAHTASMRSFSPAMTPSNASLCPPIPLVAECKTMSTPKSSGR